MINCENCKHCNALPALGYGFCVHHNTPRKLTDFCIDFEEREQYELLLQALNAIYYGEEVNNND